jgi:hypothetical protein
MPSAHFHSQMSVRITTPVNDTQVDLHTLLLPRRQTSLHGGKMTRLEAADDGSPVHEEPIRPAKFPGRSKNSCRPLGQKLRLSFDTNGTN